MFFLSTLLTLATLSFNFSFFNIPTITNQPIVQSNITQISQLQNRRDEQIVQQNYLTHRYQSNPKTFKTTIPTSTPIPTATSTPRPTIIPAATPQPTSTPVHIDNNLNAQSLFNSINNYRIKKGISPLIWDQKLATYAQQRADQYQQSGSMDHHAGFNQLTSNIDGFYKLGFRKLGENSSSGFSGNPVELVENLYAGSVKHQENQLNPGWTHMGTGVSGNFTNIIFGGGKI